MHTSWQKRSENAAFSRRAGSGVFKEDFTIRAVDRRSKEGLSSWMARHSLSAAMFDLLTGPNHLYISTNELAASVPPTGA